MAADPRDTDPVDQGLERRSEAPSISPWLVVVAVVLLGAVVYVVSALL